MQLTRTESTILSIMGLMKRSVRFHVELVEPHGGPYLGKCSLTVHGVAYPSEAQTFFRATTEPPLVFGDTVTDQVVVWARGGDFLVEEDDGVRLIGTRNRSFIGYLSPDDPEHLGTMEGTFYAGRWPEGGHDPRA